MGGKREAAASSMSPLKPQGCWGAAVPRSQASTVRVCSRGWLQGAVSPAQGVAQTTQGTPFTHVHGQDLCMEPA